MTSTIRGYLTLRRGNKKKKQQQRGNISDLFFSVTSSSVGPVSLVSHRHSRSFLDLRDLSEDAFKRVGSVAAAWLPWGLARGGRGVGGSGGGREGLGSLCLQFYEVLFDCDFVRVNLFLSKSFL